MIMILNNPNCKINLNWGGGGGMTPPPGSKPTEQSCSYNVTIST